MKPDLDLIAGLFLAVAAMMKEDYRVSKKVALRTLALAYDLHAQSPKEQRK